MSVAEVTTKYATFLSSKTTKMSVNHNETISELCETVFERMKLIISSYERNAVSLSDEQLEEIDCARKELNDLQIALQSVHVDESALINTILDIIESGTLTEQYKTKNEVASLTPVKLRMHRLSWFFKKGYKYTYNSLFNFTKFVGKKKR